MRSATCFDAAFNRSRVGWEFQLTATPKPLHAPTATVLSRKVADPISALQTAGGPLESISRASYQTEKKARKTAYLVTQGSEDHERPNPTNHKKHEAMTSLANEPVGVV